MNKLTKVQFARPINRDAMPCRASLPLSRFAAARAGRWFARLEDGPRDGSPRLLLDGADGRRPMSPARRRPNLPALLIAA